MSTEIKSQPAEHQAGQNHMVSNIADGEHHDHTRNHEVMGRILPMTSWALVLICCLIVGLVFIAVGRHLRAMNMQDGETEQLFGIEQVGGDVIKLAITDQRHLDAGWQQVRLPPAGSNHQDSNMRAQRQWLSDHCQGCWRVEATSVQETIYWFENAADAQSFAMKWFPIKSG